MTSFWIILGIGLLQVVVGAIAKSAEKRKKREAAARRLDASAPGVAVRTDPATTPRPAPPPVAAEAGGEIPIARQFGNALREVVGQAEIGFPVGRPGTSTAGARSTRSTGSPGATGTPGRPAGAGSREALLEERRRRVEALRRRQSQMTGRPEAPPPSQPRPTTGSTTGSTARTADRPVDRASGRRSASAPPPPPPTTQPTVKSTGRPPAKRAATAGVGSTQRIRAMLRQPRSLRDAILIAELLREPVALRRSPGGPPA